jgi:putative transposase
MLRANPPLRAGIRLAHNSPLSPKGFLLKFARARRHYVHWLFEAKKRFGLCVFDYAVISNHIYLLVKDKGGDVIARTCS